MHVFIKSACDSVSGDICDIRLTKTTGKKREKLGTRAENISVSLNMLSQTKPWQQDVCP